MDPPNIIGMVYDPNMKTNIAVKRLYWHLVLIFIILVLNFLRFRSLIAILTAIPFGFESRIRKFGVFIAKCR
jgi:multidrug efflux pump subunit AcrB